MACCALVVVAVAAVLVLRGELVFPGAVPITALLAFCCCCTLRMAPEWECRGASASAVGVKRKSACASGRARARKWKSEGAQSERWRPPYEVSCPWQRGAAFTFQQVSRGDTCDSVDGDTWPTSKIDEQEAE